MENRIASPSAFEDQMNVGATENKGIELYANIVPLDMELVAEVAEEFPYPSAAMIMR